MFSMSFSPEQPAMAASRLAVVIPCFRVKQHIGALIEQMPALVWRIYVIDDYCPEQTGQWVRRHCVDARIKLIFNDKNLGVGGAVMMGYQAALADGADIIIKLDGDGQMDPALIPHFVNPILTGEADYTKGNRFYDLEGVKTMPRARLIGNAILSLMTKFSSGYWNLFDPTNGYTAIHREVCRCLPLHKISRSYFFETDMLFRLNLLRAVVADVPMTARYQNEVSNLKITRIMG